MASISPNQSFISGGFFGGEFFASPAPRGHIPFALNSRGQPSDHVARTRGKFQLPITVDELIAILAERHIDDSDAVLISALRSELEQRYIELQDSYATDLLNERDRLLAERAAEERQAALERAQWLERRGKSTKRVH